MTEQPVFHMADIRRKRPTKRRAVAVGEFNPGPAGFAAILARQLPKGDALMMAEVAGLQGAKSASMLMPLCHPLLLELVSVRCLPDEAKQIIKVYCEVAVEAKTGVEMEALAGVNAALLTMYDLTKPVDPALGIGAIRLLFKEGGKKGLWLHPDGMSDAEREFYKPKSRARIDGWVAAVLTVSDRASSGQYADESGPLLQEELRALGAQVTSADVIADDAQAIQTGIRALADAGTGLVITTGGTGLGHRDITPDVLAAMASYRIPGLAEMFRSESRHHTELAWLSRADAVMIGQTLVIALPGSPKAVKQGMAILGPLLSHARAMIAGQGHP
jgi:cyclic pyranopterin monophosphate synthase